MNEMRTELRQTTISVEFNEPNGVDFYYLDSDRAIEECLNAVRRPVLNHDQLQYVKANQQKKTIPEFNKFRAARESMKAFNLETLSKHLPEDFIKETKCYTIDNGDERITSYDLLTDLVDSDDEIDSLYEIKRTIQDGVSYQDVIQRMLTPDVMELDPYERPLTLQEIRENLTEELDKKINTTPETTKENEFIPKEIESEEISY